MVKHNKARHCRQASSRLNGHRGRSLPPRSRHQRRTHRDSSHTRRNNQCNNSHPDNRTTMRISRVNLHRRRRHHCRCGTNSSFTPQLTARTRTTGRVTSNRPSGQVYKINPKTNNNKNSNMHTKKDTNMYTTQSNMHDNVNDNSAKLIRNRTDAPVVDKESSDSPVITGIGLTGLLVPQLTPTLTYGAARLTSQNGTGIVHLVYSVSFDSPAIGG